MFPLGSVSRSITSIPFITVLVILANAAVFYLELQQGERFIDRWSAVPSAIMAGREYETVITSAFLHGGWLHIISNMIFLWAFAPPMEEAMGSVKFLIFYLLGAIAAAAAHIYGDPNSSIPIVGASGAVAAVMGAFLVTYPRDSIRTLVLTPAVRVIQIPAIVLIGLWIVTQVVSVTTEPQQANAGGVAYLAHIGGAAFGIIMGRLFIWRSVTSQTQR